MRETTLCRAVCQEPVVAWASRPGATCQSPLFLAFPGAACRATLMRQAPRPRRRNRSINYLICGASDPAAA